MMMRIVMAEVMAMILAMVMVMEEKLMRLTVTMRMMSMMKTMLFMIRIMTLTQVLADASVVFGTLTGCGGDSLVAKLVKGHFSLTVVDECGQAMEAAVWGVVRYSLHLSSAPPPSTYFSRHLLPGTPASCC